MRTYLTGAAAVLALSTAASAQFTENFEGYAAGSAIEGQGGWHNWDTCGTGNRAYNTVSTAQAAAGTNSLRMTGSMDPTGGNFASDTVHEFPGMFTSGVWIFSAQTYVPAAFSGEGYIIMLNTFADCGGPYNWSVQVYFDSIAQVFQPIVPFGAAAATFVDMTGNSGGTPILYDQWVEVRAVIDLDNDIVTMSYGGVDMYSHAWTEAYGAGSVTELACLDLFPGTNETTEYFIDEISITSAPLPSIGTPYCMANPNSTGNTGSMNASGSTAAAANDVTITASNLPPNQFGIFVTSRTQGFVPNAGGTSNGNLCLGGNLGRFVGPGQILNAGAGGEFSLVLNLNAIPQGAGTVSVMAGDTWNFQAWHRDSVGLGSNFTNGVSILFN